MVDHLQAVGRVDRLPRLDADHDVLRLGVLGAHVVDVVRRDERDPRPPGDLADALVHALLLLDAVAHELEVVVAVAEDLGMLAGDRTRGLDALVADRARELALKARRQGHEPLGALAEDVLVHARAVVVAVEMGGRHERDEVLVPGEVLRKENEVPGLAVALELRVPVEAARARDVRLDADDRVDARLAAERVEVDRAVERAVVGERERRHIQGFGARDEVAQAREPVEQAVLAMRMEVDELLGDDLPHEPLGEARRLRAVYRLRDRSRVMGFPVA